MNTVTPLTDGYSEHRSFRDFDQMTNAFSKGQS